MDRNHIVSAGYIRNWAIDGMVECELVASRRRLTLGASRVGVRKKFYAGSPSADGTRRAAVAERARSTVETKALPLLRNLGDRWPLRDSHERAWVALWMSMTLCGSPRLRDQIPSNVARFFRDLERERPTFAALTRRKRSELSEADFELDSMFAEVSTVASLIGQMHWTLLYFARPVLVSSDHPIDTVAWTRDRDRSVGAPDVLLLDSSEVRLAVGPRAALLLTWADVDDRVEAVRAARHHFRLINSGVWDTAEQHRFWQPGVVPRGIEERQALRPIAPELFPGYSIRTSKRLDVAIEWTRQRWLSGYSDRAVVTTWIDQASGQRRLVPVRHTGEHAEVFSEFVL